MSAPSIPNLLSLRGSRGGGRGRLQHRRGGSPSGPGPDHDAVIQGTDNDAAVSRLSAVHLGYLDDPFAQYFVHSTLRTSSRRLPIINRGTYTRTAGLDGLVKQFLAVPQGPHPPDQEKQIISLGAGTDTRSLRLLSLRETKGVIYHEIDFPVICARKSSIVKATPSMRRILPDAKVEEHGSWRCQTEQQCQYWCHGLDLRQLTHEGPQQQQKSDAPSSLPSIPGLRADIPTLLVSECCLCYLETPEALEVIKWFADRIPNLGMLIYEPTKPDDAFGRTMVSNLAARGICMPTLETYRLPADQVGRLRDAGFEHARQVTVDEIWNRWVSEEERERVDGLEGLDEVEEWKLLAGHYVVAWGWRGSGFESWGDFR